MNNVENCNNSNSRLNNLKIESLNINGEGVTNINQTKVCVKGVLPNEVINATINYKKSNFISATLNQVITKSPQRITPSCPYCENCGGCDFQFIKSEDALVIKKQILKNYFSELFSGEITLSPSPNNFNYRNKASFFVKGNKIGFQREGTNQLVEIDNCLILNPLINKTIPILKQFLQTNSQNNITHFVVRVLGEKLNIVVVSKNSVKNIQNLVNGLKNTFLEGNFGLYENINKNPKTIMSNNFNHIYGLKNLKMQYKNITYFVHPNSFMQVNDQVKNNLYSYVLQNITQNDVVVEGYSGAGLLSAMISTKAKFVYSVEINKNATENAEQVKKQNNIINLKNINGDCKTHLPKIISENPNAVFVIDPARSGCDAETLQAVIKAKIKKIIYISCNPYTLKQNIVFLGQNYKIKSMQIFDMFPQTTHTETVTILERV